MTTARTIRRVAVGAVAALGLASALTFASCGVPAKEHADRAKPDDVPFNLLDPDPATDTTTVASGTPASIYFYDTDTGRLVRTQMVLEDNTIESALAQLQDATGSDSDPLPAGNPLGASDVIGDVTLKRGVATVDLADTFSQLSGANQQIAMAEIVFTATARPGVGQVRFTLVGEPVEVPRGDGSLSSEPLTRSDYPNLAPSS